MRKILFWLGIIVLGLFIAFAVFWVKVAAPAFACTEDSEVWVEHLSMCANKGFGWNLAVVAELNQEELCAEEEGRSCWYEFTDKNGKVLELPSGLSTFLNSDQVFSFSPYLTRVAYSTLDDSGIALISYNLDEENFETVYMFSSDNRGLTDYQWESESRFSVVGVDYIGEGLDVLVASRFTFEWGEEGWVLVKEKALEEEELL